MAFDLPQNRRNAIARTLLRALARRERSGRAPARLTEPGFATWKQFKGNLGLQHLLALVAEDASVRYPIPADLSRVLDTDSQSFAKIPENVVDGWLRELTPDLLDAPRGEAIADYARQLELPTRYAGADLHKIQADKRVLELPGTGGQLAARALERSPDAYLATNCTVLTASWAERALGGVVAMELDAPGVDFLRDDPDLAWATEPDQRNRFDLVFGLLPEKGGKWDAGTLQSRFPVATVVLV